jgi:chorismate mutase
MAWLGDDPLAYLRRRIDSVDDELAVLLARRTALTAAVQDHKAATGEYAGERGRDAEREAEIVARMAHQVPELGPEGLARVMHAVIEESLAAWETRPVDEADRARGTRPE